MHRCIVSAGFTLPTPCSALKVRAGVLRVSAAHQPLPAREVARFYLATHPRRARFSADALHRRSARSRSSRGVGRVRVASGDTMPAVRAYRRMQTSQGVKNCMVMREIAWCTLVKYTSLKKCTLVKYTLCFRGGSAIFPIQRRLQNEAGKRWALAA